jgi:hypothetical protein
LRVLVADEELAEEEEEDDDAEEAEVPRPEMS